MLSFSWGVSQPHASSGHFTGHVVPEDFSFTHAVDKSSPKLMLACAQGDAQKEVDVSFRKAGSGGGGIDYLKYSFFDVFFSSVRPRRPGTSPTSCKIEDALPFEEVTFTYGKVIDQLPAARPERAGVVGAPIQTALDFEDFGDVAGAAVEEALARLRNAMTGGPPRAALRPCRGDEEAGARGVGATTARLDATNDSRSSPAPAATSSSSSPRGRVPSQRVEHVERVAVHARPRTGGPRSSRKQRPLDHELAVADPQRLVEPLVLGQGEGVRERRLGPRGATAGSPGRAKTRAGRGRRPGSSSTPGCSSRRSQFGPASRRRSVTAPYSSDADPELRVVVEPAVERRRDRPLVRRRSARAGSRRPA